MNILNYRNVGVIKDISLNLVDCLYITARGLKLRSGEIGDSSQVEKRVRDSQVGFFPQGHWAEGILWHFGAVANAAIWKKAIVGIAPVQYTRYATGQMYDWHDDVSLPSRTGTVRALTVVFNISPRRCQGGELLLRLLHPETKVTEEIAIDELRTPGTAVVFPSETSHRVAPVTRGLRVTAVGWILMPSVELSRRD